MSIVRKSIVSRKNVIGILIAGGFSLSHAVAYAQGSITLYGLTDAALLYTSKTLNETTGQNAGHQFSAISTGMSPSNFGITGTEELGGNTKVKFKLESGISMMTGRLNDSNGNFFGRQAYVGLDSDYGSVAAGLQFSPFFIALYETDARRLSEFGSGVIHYADQVLVTGMFNSNAITYTSPTLYGFQGSVLFAFGGEPGNFQAGRQYSASLKYENGSLLVNAAVYSGKGGGTAQTPVPSTVEFWGRTIGLTYNFGVVTAKVQFVNYKVAGSFNENVYSGGLDSYVTPALNINGGVYYASDRNHTTNHSIMGAVGTTYNLSKRTALYSQFAAVNNHGAMNTGLSINGAFYGVQGTTLGATVGIRHVF
ncbi:porin [Paraburkholderia sabiae]|uniref:Porin n=1 Tax=Paraburkholderia sabiae TaxID=273251 RepID=A0ABU9QIC1_9BURK|nr:porin [Paraburkholderia sabiae]WJZ77408.1 porin [Paraburkholderia sabiae]CAD6557696.1 Outer membrane porin protein 32 [Paraburkholderia sabiae]